LAGNGPEQDLRVTATAVIRVNTDGRHLGVIGGLHSLSRHRNKPPIDPNAEKRPQFMGSQGKGAGLGEFGQRHHRRNIVGAERDDVHAAD
jgi:hypothetical protein